jgi:hypothetical protein
MATWQNTSLLMLRTMLNDAGCGESKYSNDRLEDLLITSAYIIPIDVNFSTTYTVDVEAYSISPDPISQTDGKEFISFMVLKAACIADEGNFRTAALLQGVSARCGPASITTSNYGAYLKELLVGGPCKSYGSLVEQYNFSYEGRQIIRAVMSPFAANDFDPGTQMGQLGMGDLQNSHRNRGY